MKILIVGAGAVGQVYARHLAAAGHAISFFVKPQYAAALADGMALHRLRHFRTQSEVWRDYALVSTLEAVASQSWDQIWLCMASDALRSTLTRELLAQVGDATVVCLQPGPDDVEQVRNQLPQSAQLVQGLITFISYQSPLPGRSGPEGMAYYLPPMAPGIFSGEKSRVDALVQALKKGGMAARVVGDVAKSAGGGDGLLIPLIAALEQNDWRLTGFASTTAFVRGREAAAEALSILERAHGAQVAPTRLVLQPLASRALLALAPRLLPLELEPYLHYHFSKVGVQTRQMLESYIALGERLQLPVIHLQELRHRLS